jgi:hypothetical protein
VSYLVSLIKCHKSSFINQSSFINRVSLIECHQSSSTTWIWYGQPKNPSKAKIHNWFDALQQQARLRHREDSET